MRVNTRRHAAILQSSTAQIATNVSTYDTFATSAIELSLPYRFFACMNGHAYSVLPLRLLLIAAVHVIDITHKLLQPRERRQARDRLTFQQAEICSMSGRFFSTSAVVIETCKPMLANSRSKNSNESS